MLNWVINFHWNGLIGLALYWVPMLFCAVFYTIRTAEGYMRDTAAREESAKPVGDKQRQSIYIPQETIGAILGRALVSVIPIANLWAALFDLSPKVFSRLFDAFDRIFDQPLVPPNKS